jgi:signal transduction histidine kinase
MQVAGRFHYWMIIALAVGAFMCFRLSRISKDDIERRFYMSLVRMFLVIFGLMIFTHVLLAQRLPVLGNFFLVACALAPMFPTIIFSYFILRYNYMEYALKRSIFYSLFAIFVLSVYIFGIRQIGDFLERTLNIDFRIIEAILVIALIVLIEPLRERFQASFNALFFREQSYYRRVFTELSHRLGSLQGIEVGRLLRYVANSVQAAMRLSACKIILFREEDGKLTVDEASAPPLSVATENIRESFQAAHTHSISLWQANDPAIVREMKALDATLVLPIYRDDSLAGIMALGPSTEYSELYESEIEMLSILLNHLVTAVDNTRLIQDKLDMERRMFADEKWMSLGRLSGRIAHEVKNPLSSIKAITHVMREEFPQDNRFNKDLAMVESEIDKLSGVVNQLLQVARPARGDERYADMRDVIENVANVLRAGASRDDIIINCRYDEAPPVKADAVSLREIVFNLMQNGIQAMSPGGTLSVSVLYPAPPEYADKPSVLVEIRDTGPGIPDEERSKIFEAFYTTREGGSGLGLWIVREKLADLGGTIGVESDVEDGMGTTIRITIPIERRPAPMEQTLRSAQTAGSAEEDTGSDPDKK